MTRLPDQSLIELWSNVKLVAILVLNVHFIEKFLSAVVVAQLVERLLPTSEVHGSNPVIGNNFYWMLTVNCIEKTKRKRGRERPIKKVLLLFRHLAEWQ